MKLILRVVGLPVALWFVWIGLVHTVQAQISSPARILGIGVRGSGSSGETGDLFANPAGMTVMTSPGILLAHRYAHHQPDVSAQAIAGSLPVFNYHLGVFYLQYGLPDAYRDSAFGFYFGKRFGPRLRMALGLHTKRLNIPGYVSERTIDLKAGMQFDMPGGFTLGVVLDDLSLSSSQYAERQIPSVTVGGLYLLGEQVRLLADLRIRPDGQFSIQGGLEYMMVPETIFLRLGMSSPELLPAAGLGISWRRYRIDAASTFHARLGMSPQFDLIVKF